MTERVEPSRSWATIPEASTALRRNRQTIRNHAVDGKIPGAVRDDDEKQRPWKIPGAYICDEVAKRRGEDPAETFGVKIRWQRQIPRSTDVEFVTRTVWRTEELAAAARETEK